jgi:acetyl esterase/lipase
MRPSTAAALTSLGIVAAAAAVSKLVTPRPAIALIRRVFDRGTRSCVLEMEQYSTAGPVDERPGIRFGRAKDGTRYDLYRPVGEVRPRPTIVWIHGGAWVSGSRVDIGPYVRDLAFAGYTTVTLDYSVGPEAKYPTPLGQIDEALRHLLSNAHELGVDPGRIVLAGDSAGAQLASQIAAAVTNPGYAATLGLTPALLPDQLAGVILHCGIYDFDAVAEQTGVLAWGFHKALWAYTGTRDWTRSPLAAGLSTLPALTPDFPPTFISGGDADPLTASQSVPFADRLDLLGVPTARHLWEGPRRPVLPHEYQFHAHLPEAREVFEALVSWLGKTFNP